MQRKPRLPGVDLRPGSVRVAREEAGLSLAQVAGTEVTRAAIYLVELGRSRPSMRTLRLIAERTGKPLDFFLAHPEEASQVAGAGVSGPQDELKEIERLLAAGRRRQARARARRQLARSRGADSAYLGRLALRLGQAEHELNRTEPALASLQRARDFLATAGDVRTLAECTDALGAALHRLENPDALATFNEALRLCEQTAPVDRSLLARILGHIGAHYTSTHDWDAAIRHYERALSVSGNIRGVAFLERMHNDLGLAHQEAGNTTVAFGHLQRALGLAEMGGDLRVIARLENNIGSVLVELGELDAAGGHLHRSLELCARARLAIGRGHVLCSLAELDLVREDLESADRHIEEAIELTQRIGESLTEADAHQLAARVAEQRNDYDSAAASFWRALALLNHAGAPRRLIECRAAFAAMLERRGDLKGALDHATAAIAVAVPQLGRRAEFGMRLRRAAEEAR